MERRLFEDLVLSRSGGGGTHTRAGAMPFSIVIHGAGLAGLLALSMAVRDDLPPLPEPPRITNYLPRGGGSVSAPSRPRRVAPRRPTTAPTFDTVPAALPQPEIFDIDDGPVGDPGPGDGSLCVGCAPGPGGPDGDPNGSDPVGIGPSIAPAVPVRIGPHVQPPRKVRHVDPVYPELARKARVTGIVLLECVIDREGVVRSVAVLSGHPLLERAAVDAVRQWTYRPTLLNGVPVEIVMTVTVHFTF